MILYVSKCMDFYVCLPLFTQEIDQPFGTDPNDLPMFLGAWNKIPSPNLVNVWHIIILFFETLMLTTRGHAKNKGVATWIFGFPFLVIIVIEGVSCNIGRVTIGTSKGVPWPCLIEAWFIL